MLKRSGGQFIQKRLMSHVKFSVNGTARIVTLDRPKKLNALNTEMCKKISSTLKEYKKSKINNVIIINSSSNPRSFCAGGDVASIAKSNLSNDFYMPKEFFTEEYSLNWLLATYNKPIVSIMDGITMGGGVGLATHVPFRIATENTKWAMPEMDIGFFPDVGTTFSLSKMTTLGGNDGQLALYLCLSGDILCGADSYIAGLASHYVPHATLKELEVRLGELPVDDDVELIYNMTNSVIEEFSSSLPNNYKFKYSGDELDVIERVFFIGNSSNPNSISNIYQSLDNIISSMEFSETARDFANQTKEKLLKKSQISLEIAREQFQRNHKSDIQSALKQDLITATNMSLSPDLCEFSESVNNKLILKNKSYNWKLGGLTLSQMSRLLSENPSNPVSLNNNDISAVTWKKYPHHDKFQLPTEEQIQECITGHSIDNGSSVTKKEVLSYFSEFNEFTKGKIGVDYLVNFVISRKCKLDQDRFLRWKY